MKTIIEKLILLIPFATAFGYWGFSKNTGERLAAIAAAILVAVLSFFWQKYSERKKYEKEAKNLYPQFDYLSIRKAAY